MFDKVKFWLEWKFMILELSYVKFGLSFYVFVLLCVVFSVVCWGREFGGCKMGECGVWMMVVRLMIIKIWYWKYG